MEQIWVQGLASPHDSSVHVQSPEWPITSGSLRWVRTHVSGCHIAAVGLFWGPLNILSTNAQRQTLSPFPQLGKRPRMSRVGRNRGEHAQLSPGAPPSLVHPGPNQAPRQGQTWGHINSTHKVLRYTQTLTHTFSHTDTLIHSHRDSNTEISKHTDVYTFTKTHR